MFVIPSRNRVEKLKLLAESMGEDDRKLPTMVVLCTMDPQWEDYFRFTWPIGWQIHVAEGDYTYCGEKMNWAYHRLPNARYYGHICDDVQVDTPNKMRELTEVAGDWNVAVPNDQRYSGGLACFPVSGGKLTRLWGWWAHPQFKHNCLDSIIDDIARATGAFIYCEDIKYKLTHPLFGDAEWDDTYTRVIPVNQEAGNLYHAIWEGSAERQELVDRCRQARSENGCEVHRIAA